MNKQYTITRFSHAEVDAPKETFGFMKIPASHTLIRAEGENIQVSDGYHTMDELYDHRIALWIKLCSVISAISRSNNAIQEKIGKEPILPIFPGVWRSKHHSDGSQFEGWFVLGINSHPGTQITYHFPMSMWEETHFAYTLSLAPEWDGHTSTDVLERLKNL